MQLTPKQRDEFLARLDSYNTKYMLTDDHIESAALQAKIDILNFLLAVLK